ncbi:uncharacterized protein CLUP02_07767 [Colletotrichum lupini]|uniref:Uncharacterized protein n=1 Tax=Colletotrichum lupini TaxID=145971 RepID=A0A9Q8WH00_9PEZI|nr:uncharacterized protein CLUP02_07767 [Colletotrichum lupini]UQC82280.1 hypothetical protein CLUP02_07767 [Colletotrichum lupini]
MRVGDGVEWPLFWVNRPPEHPRHANALSRLPPASPAHHRHLSTSIRIVRVVVVCIVRAFLVSLQLYRYSTHSSFNCHGNSPLAPHILTCRETAFAPFALGAQNIHALEWYYVMRPPHLDVFPHRLGQHAARESLTELWALILHSRYSRTPPCTLARSLHDMRWQAARHCHSTLGCREFPCQTCMFCTWRAGKLEAQTLQLDQPRQADKVRAWRQPIGCFHRFRRSSSPHCGHLICPAITHPAGGPGMIGQRRIASRRTIAMTKGLFHRTRAGQDATDSSVRSPVLLISSDCQPKKSVPPVVIKQSLAGPETRSIEHEGLSELDSQRSSRGRILSRELWTSHVTGVTAFGRCAIVSRSQPVIILLILGIVKSCIR